MGCSFNGAIINHLYYADDLVLIAPSSNGMQKSIIECESFANKYELNFNEMKSVLLFFKPVGFKLNPFLRMCWNDVPIPIETSCHYLGHIINKNVSDNEDIRRQLRFVLWTVKHAVKYLWSFFVWSEIIFVYVSSWKYVYLKNLAYIRKEAALWDGSGPKRCLQEILWLWQIF